ncbi:hypothetical protein BY996DRAFT_6624790 [Phakopsora pachyrhizi]|nr:hypothetical protein BY996DRAFT_6624790 [Phakopsora pachyrhizi]
MDKQTVNQRDCNYLAEMMKGQESTILQLDSLRLGVGQGKTLSSGLAAPLPVSVPQSSLSSSSSLSAFKEGSSSESPELFRSSATDLDGSRHTFMSPTDIKADRERKQKAEMARFWNQFF